MAKLLHMRLSVAGLLERSDSELEQSLRDDKGQPIHPADARKILSGMLENGTKFIQNDPECNNFDMRYGCLGHHLGDRKLVVA